MSFLEQQLVKQIQMLNYEQTKQIEQLSVHIQLLAQQLTRQASQIEKLNGIVNSEKEERLKFTEYLSSWSNSVSNYLEEYTN